MALSETLEADRLSSVVRSALLKTSAASQVVLPYNLLLQHTVLRESGRKSADAVFAVKSTLVHGAGGGSVVRCRLHEVGQGAARPRAGSPS